MIKKLLSKALHKLADDLDGGNCNMSEEEMMEIFEHVIQTQNSNSHLTKEQACRFLGISQPTFNRRVAEGKIPKGRKEAGCNQLFWSKSELALIKH